MITFPCTAPFYLPTEQSGQRAVTGSRYQLPILRWDPATLNDEVLVVEELGRGSLTERVVITLPPEYPLQGFRVRKRVKAVEEVVVEGLEQRIKDSEISSTPRGQCESSIYRNHRVPNQVNSIRWPN